MNPKAKHIKFLTDYRMLVEFTNGEIKQFDFKPYLKYPIYEPLQSPPFFKQASIVDGILVWSNDIDFCPDRLYLESCTVK